MRAPRPEALWLAVALAGAALVLLAATLTNAVAGPGLPPDSGSPVILAGDTAATWELTTAQPGLSELTVWLEQPAPAGAALALAISRADLPAIPLVTTTVSLDPGGSDLAVAIPFDPLRMGDAPHTLTTTLHVQLAVALPGTRVALLGSRAPGAEERTPAFATRYQVRPFDALLPISRMADGRPGLLGWPPTYALLAYAFLALLAYAAVRHCSGVRPPSPALRERGQGG